MSRKRRGEWLDDSEYPDERDTDEFGEDSPFDYDPLSIGRVGSSRAPFWTRGRIVVAVVLVILLLAFIAAAAQAAMTPSTPANADGQIAAGR